MITDPNKIRVAIVDDEELARERMRALLAGHNDIEVVAECADGAEARRFNRARDCTRADGP